MAKSHEIILKERQTTLSGLQDLIVHLERAVQVNQLDPRFVEKMLQKIRQEVDEKLPVAEHDPKRMTLLTFVDGLALQIVQKKAGYLSDRMAHLRETDDSAF